MPTPITDPDLINFANQQIRVLADKLIQSANLAQTILTIWQARGYADRISNDASVEVVDGARNDGRSVITGADVNNILEIAQEVLALGQANNNAHISQLLRVAVNIT